MSGRIRFSTNRLDFEEIAAHYSDLEESIVLYYSNANPAYATRFYPYTDEEIFEEREHRIKETESAMAMTLLAAIEASFRVDYLQRCFRRKKDKLSREFRNLYKERQGNVSLEKEILEIWKKHSDVPVSLVGEIRSAFKYRHWLAHGRYWVPKIGRSYDFLSIHILAETVNLAFGFDR